MTKCACDCNLELPGYYIQNRKFIQGHRRKYEEQLSNTYCLCGCGVLLSKYSKTKYIRGHKKARIEDLRSLPPQFCLCGCGQLAAPGRKYVSTHNLTSELCSFAGSQTQLLHPNQSRDNGIKTHQRYPNQSRDNARKVQKLYPNLSSNNLKKAHANDPTLASRAGKIGGRRLHEIYPEEFFSQIAIEVHRKYPNMAREIMTQVHKDYPNMAAESGRKAQQRYPELYVRRGRELGRHNVESGQIRKAIEANVRAWADPIKKRNRLMKVHKSQSERPTPLEHRPGALIVWKSLPWHYTGDGENWFGSKPSMNPDYTHDYLPKVAEVANKHDKWRRSGKTWQEWEQWRVSHFTKFGYKCIILWDDLSDEQMTRLLEDSNV